MKEIMLPLGIDRFEKVRTGGFYYIDKTGFIEELLTTQFEVNLITRPRRFGKTLTMSMLEDLRQKFLIAGSRWKVTAWKR